MTSPTQLIPKSTSVHIFSANVVSLKCVYWLFRGHWIWKTAWCFDIFNFWAPLRHHHAQIWDKGAHIHISETTYVRNMKICIPTNSKMLNLKICMIYGRLGRHERCCDHKWRKKHKCVFFFICSRNKRQPIPLCFTCHSNISIIFQCIAR